MDDNRSGSLLPPRAEKRLVKAVSDAVKQSCANPDRIDCPGSEAIEAIAVRRLSHPNFDDTVDHIAMCGPCLEEYNRRRREYRLRRRLRWVAGFAALLAFGLLWKYLPFREVHPPEHIVRQSQPPLLTATLDYSGWTSERSASPLTRSRETPRVSRGRLALTVALPIGTEDGPYTVRLRSAAGDIVAQANGIAAWNGTVDELKVNLDLSRIAAGTYTLAIQSSDTSQRTYPVLLE